MPSIGAYSSAVLTLTTHIGAAHFLVVLTLAMHIGAAHSLLQCVFALDAGTYVRFQPRSADFQTALGSGMELALQASMFTHTTLTEGEWVQIAHEGASHDVKVLALQPESAVSVIGKPQKGVSQLS